MTSSFLARPATVRGSAVASLKTLPSCGNFGGTGLPLNPVWGSRFAAVSTRCVAWKWVRFCWVLRNSASSRYRGLRPGDVGRIGGKAAFAGHEGGGFGEELVDFGQRGFGDGVQLGVGGAGGREDLPVAADPVEVLGQRNKCRGADLRGADGRRRPVEDHPEHGFQDGEQAQPVVGGIPVRVPADGRVDGSHDASGEFLLGGHGTKHGRWHAAAGEPPVGNVDKWSVRCRNCLRRGAQPKCSVTSTAAWSLPGIRCVA